MSVLIKGMEMPNVCSECWALDVYDDCIACLITQERRGYNFRKQEKRMKKCPRRRVRCIYPAIRVL